MPKIQSSFRLPPDVYPLLDGLCARYGITRPMAVAFAVRQAAAKGLDLTPTGPAPAPDGTRKRKGRGTGRGKRPGG